MPSRTRSSRIATPVVGAVAAALLLAACGDDDTDEAAEIVDPVQEQDTLITPQLDGLEVTVTGNVTEQMEDEAFQIDKDGLGDESTTLSDPESGLDFEADYYVGEYDLYDFYDYDYDYYDYDYYIAHDVDFDDFDESSVLVITPGGVEVSVGDAVQVNGTLRYFDALEVADVYDLDLEADVYGSYENQYVLIADAVKSIPADRETAMEASSNTDDTPATTDTTVAGSSTTSTSAATDDDPTTTATSEPDGDDEGSTSTTEPTTGDQ